jgi:hypothetical protein
MRTKYGGDLREGDQVTVLSGEHVGKCGEVFAAGPVRTGIVLIGIVVGKERIWVQPERVDFANGHARWRVVMDMRRRLEQVEQVLADLAVKDETDRALRERQLSLPWRTGDGDGHVAHRAG